MEIGWLSCYGGASKLESDPRFSLNPIVGGAPSQDLSSVTSAEFLALLTGKNIHLYVRDGRLVVDAPTGVLDDLLRSELKRRKADLLTLLQKPENDSRPPLLPADRRARIQIGRASCRERV